MSLTSSFGSSRILPRTCLFKQREKGKRGAEKVKASWRFVLLCFLATPACTLTRHSEAKPHMFLDKEHPEAQLASLDAQYESVVVGKTTWADLGEAGFQFGDSNVRIVSGAEAVKIIFGENVFQGLVRNPDQLDVFLSEFNPYRLVLIPHKDVSEKSDLIYFSEMASHRFGHDIKFTIVLKDDLVVYKTKSIEHMDEHELEKAFGLGFLRFLGLVSGEIDKGRKIGGATDAFGH